MMLATMPPQIANIQDWLVKKISTMTDMAFEEIRLDAPLSSYGLDSVHAISLVGEINNWLNLELEPTLAWDYPTIEELSTYLVSELAA